MGEIIHNEQGKGADNLAFVFGEIDSVVGIAFYPGKYFSAAGKPKRGLSSLSKTR